MKSAIKTFESACKKLGLDPKKVLPDASRMPGQHQEAIVAMAKLFIIAEALNDGWKADWSDSSQWKYTPWFRVTKSRGSASGLAYYGYAIWDSYSSVGSRLCFKSSDLAEYAGKQFKSLYERAFLFQ